MVTGASGDMKEAGIKSVSKSVTTEKIFKLRSRLRSDSKKILPIKGYLFDPSITVNNASPPL
jgi:hypothetical protein